MASVNYRSRPKPIRSYYLGLAIKKLGIEKFCEFYELKETTFKVWMMAGSMPQKHFDRLHELIGIEWAKECEI